MTVNLFDFGCFIFTEISDETADENKEEPLKRELKTELIEKHNKKPRLSKSIVARIDIPPSQRNQGGNSVTTNSTLTGN